VRHERILDHLGGAGEQREREVRPSAWAVLRLKTSSNFVGCITDSGFRRFVRKCVAPIRISPIRNSFESVDAENLLRL
jgi:hypothetical protein